MMSRHVFFIRSGIAGTLLLFLILVFGCSPESGTQGRTDSTGANKTTDTIAEPEIPLTTPDGEPARFAFRSGEVEMVYEGDFQGIRRLTFTDYGMRERRLDSATPAYEPLAVVPPQQLAIVTPDFHGVVDLRAEKGQKMRNVSYQKYRQAWESLSRPFGEIALERSGGTRLTDTTLMGNYRCRVYRQKGQTFIRTIWTWGGVPIRETLARTDGQQGSFVAEPRSVRTDIVVPDSLFTFPEGYGIEEIPYGSGH